MEALGIIIVIIFAIWTFRAFMKAKKEGKKGMELLQNFESRMNSRGFTKRIVVYDFLSESTKESVGKMFKHWWTVGMWLDYQKQLMTLRPDRDTWNEIDIPFNKIRNVEALEDGYAITSSGAIEYGGFSVGAAKTKEISKGLQVRIVTGDINTGTKAYFLNLYDPKYGAKLDKSHPDYRSIQECTRTIADEINNIIRFVGQH